MKELLAQLDKRTQELQGQLTCLEFKPDINPQSTLADLFSEYKKKVKTRAVLETELAFLTGIRPTIIAALEKQEQEQAQVAAEQAEQARLVEQSRLLAELDNVAFGTCQQASLLARLAQIVK